MRSLRQTLIRGAAGTLFLKVSSTGLSFLLSLILARLLKAEGLGVYSYALAWVYILSIPSIMGLESLLIREVSVFSSRSEWSGLKGLIRFAWGTVLISSAVIMMMVFLYRYFHTGSSEKLEAFAVAIVLLPLISITAVNRSILKGLQRVVIAQVPELLLQPTIFIGLILLFYIVSRDTIQPISVILFNLSAMFVATVIVSFLLYRYLPEGLSGVAPEYHVKKWLKSGLTLLLLTGMGFINSRTDIVMLGAMKEARVVGIYTVASAGASLVPFVLLSVNTSLGPIISRLYHSGQKDLLQREITHTARLILLFSLPVAIILIMFGRWFLMLYGEEFTAGADALAILCAGQVINIAAGSVGLILIMTGYERDASLGLGIGAVVNVVLNLLLIPRWSMNGAAVATAISMATWNLVMAWFVRKRLGLYTTALGDLRRLKVWRTGE